MRKSLICVAVLTLCTAPAAADLVVSVDENGQGTANGSSMPGRTLTDPTTGSSAFGYLLPATVTVGDLLLTEPGQNGTLSDLIRFAQLPGSTITGLFFYSDPPESGETGDRADLGIPSNRQSNLLTKAEVGAEGRNGFVYTPTVGQPGYGGPGTSYTIASDKPTPEPGSAVLLACGSLVLGVWARRRRARAA
jgi:hypothetical protein